MLFSYPDCLKKWQSEYHIKKQISEGNLYQIERGVYSDVPDISTLAVITFKCPKGIITMDSAFYYHGLTDVIPDEFHIATDKHAIYHGWYIGGYKVSKKSSVLRNGIKFLINNI